MNYLMPIFENSVINNLNINISTAMCVSIDNDWFGENIVSPFSRIYYIKSGNGEITAGGKTYLLSSGDVCLIPVGQKFSYASKGNMEKLYFHFTISRPDGYDLLRDFDKIGIINRDVDSIENLYKLFNSKIYSDTFLLKSTVYSDVLSIIQKYGINNSFVPEYSEIVSRTMKIIIDAPSIKLSHKEIAKMLFISESLLSKQFKKETGMSIGEYIDHMVFYDAQTRLIETTQSIAEISNHYGFCDRFYFSRRFKQLFNETPVEYRKRLKSYQKSKGE